MAELSLAQDSCSRKSAAVYNAAMIEAHLFRIAQDAGNFEVIRRAHEALTALVSLIEEIPDEA